MLAGLSLGQIGRTAARDTSSFPADGRGQNLGPTISGDASLSGDPYGRPIIIILAGGARAHGRAVVRARALRAAVRIFSHVARETPRARIMRAGHSGGVAASGGLDWLQHQPLSIELEAEQRACAPSSRVV